MSQRLTKDSAGMNKIKNDVINAYISDPHKSIDDIAREYDVSTEEVRQWIREFMDKSGYVDKEEIDRIRHHLRMINIDIQELKTRCDIDDRQMNNLHNMIVSIAIIVFMLLMKTPECISLIKGIVNSVWTLTR